jgi:nucleoporin NUP42
VRIWFPGGAPNYYKETELPDEAYDADTLRLWDAFEKTGIFDGGFVPELPPKRIHCRWDF